MGRQPGHGATQLLEVVHYSDRMVNGAVTTRMLYVTPVQSWAFCLITSHILSSSLIEKVHQDVAYASMPLTLKSFDSMPYVLAMSHSVVTRLCAESIFRKGLQDRRIGGVVWPIDLPEFTAHAAVTCDKWLASGLFLCAAWRYKVRSLNIQHPLHWECQLSCMHYTFHLQQDKARHKQQESRPQLIAAPHHKR